MTNTAVPVSLILLESQRIWAHSELIRRATDPSAPSIEDMGGYPPSWGLDRKGAATLHQPQSCFVEKHSHEPWSALQPAREAPDFLCDQDDG